MLIQAPGMLIRLESLMSSSERDLHLIRSLMFFLLGIDALKLYILWFIPGYIPPGYPSLYTRIMATATART